MPKRSYDQYCCLAQALDVVGERWTLLVVRELLLGPRRYGELRANLPGVGTNLLADRLRELRRAGIVERVGGGRRAAYALTELGESLEPVVLALARWGMRLLPGPGPETVFRPEWAVIALRAMADSARADRAESYEFRIDGVVFHLRVEDHRVETGTGAARQPAVVLTTDARTFLEVGAGRLEPFAAVGSGRLGVEGGPGALARLAHLLGLDEPPRRAAAAEAWRDLGRHGSLSGSHRRSRRPRGVG